MSPASLHSPGPAVPDPAITWILHNDCISNEHFATLSNVCKGWRELCRKALVVEAISSTGIDLCSSSLESLDAFIDKESKVHGNNSSTLRKLLLADMTRELVIRQGKYINSDDKRVGSTDGNFCLAWFAPSGIQITSVSIDDEEKNLDSDEFKFDFAQKETKTSRKKSSGKNNNNSVSCCREWRGYRHATEVLTPFGYTTSFVRDVLDSPLNIAYGNMQSDASNTSAMMKESMPTSTNPTLKRSTSDASQARMSKISSLKFNPTFSVRGATLARSEGYCLCLEDEYIAQHLAQQKSGRIDDWMDLAYYELSEHRIRPHNKKLSPSERVKKQSTLARSLLPRVIMSTRRKAPIMHRFDAEDADGDKGHRDESIHDPHKAKCTPTQSEFLWEKRQRAVQFLNCDRSQAVRLITPNFDCGGIKGPITMFIVAITTEDGCFVSGKKSRFEFGHMYPLNNRDMLVDMSPICIATGKNDAEVDTSYSTDYSDDSVKCLCNFNSSDPFNPHDIPVDDPSEDCIHRGTFGPGLWHCYVAVFDGKSSIIRVDGEQEPQQISQHQHEKGCNDSDDPSDAGKLVGSGVLDGLTIGSDHHFDMSLCYGEMDGECGQGAISELAVFKGRMDTTDIIKLEGYLMKKHGICSAKKQREFISEKNEARMQPIKIGNQREEDEWRRQAHALITQRPPWDLVGDPVPLRVAANHTSVAWQRVDEITGMPLRVSRIGHKTGNGSSDW